MPAVLRTSCAIAAILACAAHLTAQIQPRDARPAGTTPTPAGTAILTGTVMMAGTSQPARKARVTLTGAELRGSRTATTDDQGRFSFTDLPAGRYSLSATRPGYLTVSYGARQPGRPGTQIQLSDGQKFEAQLQIPRGSVITGMVADENGEASPQVQVRLMRFVTQNGQRTLQQSSSATTDDRGIYRIFNLLPGEYVVCAVPRNTMITNMTGMLAEMQGLQQALEAVRANPEQARAIGARIGALQRSTPASEESGATGYAPICYPGSIATANASAVTVGIAEEKVGIDIQLQLAPMAVVDGTVINSTGAQLRDISVTLSEINPFGQSLPNLGSRADGEGRFRIPNVPPGQYRLTARANIGGPAGRGGGRGGGNPLQRPDAIIVWASADVVVDGRNVSNVMLTLQQGVSVSGTLSFQGVQAPPSDLTRLRVTMAPVGPNPFGGGASSARVDANGRFTIPSVPPGRYRLSATGATGWFAESSIIGGEDALDFPFEVRGNQNVSGAVITFTDRQTELTGTVTNERGQPAVEYTLVAFPADQRYWGFGTSRRIQATRPATDGRYVWRGLPPGDYRIAPVFDADPGMLSDPTFLQQLEANSLRITLQPGEKKVQDIRFGA